MVITTYYDWIKFSLLHYVLSYELLNFFNLLNVKLTNSY